MGFPVGKICLFQNAIGLGTELSTRSHTSLALLDPLAAFIDVGSEPMHVSIAGGAAEVFGTFTIELYRLRDWLKERGVKSVAMEATGVYWLPVYGVLEKGA